MKEKLKVVWNLIGKMYYFCIGIALIALAVMAFRKYWDERELFMSMYSHASEEVREHCIGYNLEIGGYRRKYVKWQTMTYRDFGSGELRYSKYAVKVPVEYDATFQHVKRDITIAVYLYKPWNVESVGQTPDPSIPDHFYVEGMFDDLRGLFGE